MVGASFTLSTVILFTLLAFLGILLSGLTYVWKRSVSVLFIYFIAFEEADLEVENG